MNEMKPLPLRDQVALTANALMNAAAEISAVGPIDRVTLPEVLRSHAADLRASAEAEKAVSAPTDKQRQIDVSNLTFYAEMFRQHEWGTVVIHWSVFEATLKEVAARIKADGSEIERSKAVNAELVAALNAVDGLIQSSPDMSGDPRWHFRLISGKPVEQVCAQVKAAIARAEGRL